jgi:hypothetical protein
MQDMERENEVEEEVERIERTFLEGSFRESLRLANRFLLEREPTVAAARHDEDVCELRQTPLHLQFDLRRDDSEQLRTMSIRWTASGRTDRVAVIALQSWYELSQQASEEDKGFRHLQPFLDTYCEGHDMSLPLMVVWIRFCIAMKHVQEAIDLTAEVLAHVRGGCSVLWFDPVNEEKWMEERKAVQDLVLLLFSELLPVYYQSAEAVDDFLKRLVETSIAIHQKRDVKPEVPVHEPKVLREVLYRRSPQKEVIQKVLCFCNTDDENWPPWLEDSFAECRAVLQSMLSDIYHHETTTRDRPAENKSSVVEDDVQTNDPSMSITTHTRNPPETDSWSVQQLSIWKESSEKVKWILAAVRVFVKKQFHRLRSVSVWESSSSHHDLRQCKLACFSLALAVLVAFYYGRGGTMGQRIKPAVWRVLKTVLLQPAVEILQAFGLPPPKGEGRRRP